MTDYILPSKLPAAFRRLKKHYGRKGLSDLERIIEASSFYVNEESDYDDWNGGVVSHDVVLFVSEEVEDSIDLDHQKKIYDRLRDDINKATTEVESEYIRAVHIRADDEADPWFQAATKFSRESRSTPGSVALWKGKALRVFISHRDKHKALAYEVAESLEPYGVTAFVAHDAIKPMKEWQQEILNGLETMEVLLILLTDDFHDSEWTDQEVGFALGSGVPVICLKVGRTDPKGFIGSRQALKVPPEEMHKLAPMVHKTLVNEIGQEGRLKEIMIESFLNSPSYFDARDNLRRLTETADKLTDKEFQRIVKGYADNDQLYTCGAIRNRNDWFKRYLESATGKTLVIDRRVISEVIDDSDESFPF